MRSKAANPPPRSIVRDFVGFHLRTELVFVREPEENKSIPNYTRGDQHGAKSETKGYQN